MNSERLEKQLQFVLEIDKLKTVIRQTLITTGERLENSAEHSWHLALMALVLAEHANEPVDVGRVIKLVLVHDIVEIDAGDTFAYDKAAHDDKAEREQQAAVRIFGLLPDEQRDEFMALWHEFEARETAEARFANALDRFMPLVHNYHTQGRSWREHGVVSRQVLTRNRPIEDGSEALWQVAKRLIEESVEKGYLGS